MLRKAMFVVLLWSCLKSVNAALFFNPTYINGATQSWDGVTQRVVQQAFSDWQQVFSGVANTTVAINVTVTFANAGGNGFLALWQGGFSASVGATIRPWSPGVNHTLLFNADLMNPALSNRLWFDPTPTDTGADKAFGDWDALSVARHEIGHMLGFTALYRNNFATASETNPWTSRITANVFDPGGLNVPMEIGDPSHVVQDSLLMDTALSSAEGRIGISLLEGRMLSLAYGYDLISTPVPEPTPILFILSAAPLALIWRLRRRASSLHIQQ